MGNKLSCKRGHRLEKVDFGTYSSTWCCNLCGSRQHGLDNRFRCVDGCNFDVCRSCMQTHLTDSQLQFAYGEETCVLVTPRLRELDFQSMLPHPHYVAYVPFRCDECNEHFEGNRLHCPEDRYDICRSCAARIALDSSDDGIRSDEVKSITVDRKPFAEGTSREAYKATVKLGNGNTAPYVLKCWKTQFYDVGFDMEECVRIHLKAKKLAKEFNQVAKTNHPVIFGKPILFVMSETSTRSRRKMFVQDEKVMLEPFIDGEYVKFSSNNGWCSNKYSVPEAFTHFTWHKTKKLIVCDLQGIRRAKKDSKDGYYLTDPAICSLRAGKWGFTDLGPDGIYYFFANHQCNVICHGWDKPKDLRKPDIFSISRSTSYIDFDAVHNCLAAVNKRLAAVQL